LKTEIKIILEEGSSNKQQGNCFETLIRNLLSAHQYEIRSNINFSGMEIDLIAEHKHKKETLYVECKAKEKVTSDELTKFAFNVSHKKANAGYFFRTKELEYQAGALLKDLKDDNRYNNLTFFEPSQIVTILSDAKFITEPQLTINEFNIAKRILAITYFGDFLIYTINESTVLPTKFILANAQKPNKIITDDHKLKLIKEIEDLYGLEEITTPLNKEIIKENINKPLIDIETISEVQSSENWYDYLPASSKDFIGREKIRGQVFEFLKDVLEQKTTKRIFYLTGKSGWGKSSLVSEIRGRSRNKFYKNRFYTLAIDTRSATSDNFVALAFDKLIVSSKKAAFLKLNAFEEKISFTSNVDLLSSESIQQVLNLLQKGNKVLILIFDQFEDVFRKQGLFKSFYKFLSDVTDRMPNLIIGFSWKTEIVIPIDHEAYSYWQQSKDQAKEFNVQEFSEKEIDGVIKQLESSVGKLTQEIKRRIKESSQGLPWLTKKLCIHIYEQINSGLKKDKLIDANLNIKELFENEKERIEGVELSALKYIAKKAYDGNFFDISEIGDQISNTTIESLRDKRLIIRSGANYNIYWDIFRDYLVTNEVPPIGESYILRQGVNVCLEVFLLFETKDSKMTLELLLKEHPRKIGIASLENVLIELRNVGLVQKIENTEEYNIAVKDIDITREGFINYITEKFKNYTPILKLIKYNLKVITKDDIVNVLKDTFKYEFQDNTWNIYAVTLIGWIFFSKHQIKEKIAEPQKGRRSGYSKNLNLDESNLLPRSSFNEIILEINKFNKLELKISKPFVRDLLLIGMINTKRELTDYGSKVLDDINNNINQIVEKVRQLPKMQTLNTIVEKEPKIKAKELIKRVPQNFFDAKKDSSKIIYASKVLTWLKNTNR